MIKVTRKSEKLHYFFPKIRSYAISHGHKPLHSLKLIGIGEEVRELVVQDSNIYNDFYIFNLSFEDFEDGEYKYTIDDYETGLIIIGSLEPEVILPEDDKDKYIEYE